MTFLDLFNHFGPDGGVAFLVCFVVLGLEFDDLVDAFRSGLVRHFRMSCLESGRVEGEGVDKLRGGREKGRSGRRMEIWKQWNEILLETCWIY